MKSIPVALALLVLTHPILAGGLEEKETLNSLIEISSVNDEPLVLVGADPGSEVREAGSELQKLRQDLQGTGARLREARRAVEVVVAERDEARGEVSALTMANHRMQMEIRRLQKEKDQALQEAVVWKARAEEKVKPASGTEKAGGEMAGLKAEVDALRTDLIRVREELKDPIERVSLREQLISAREHGERLEKEITTVLESREEERRAASRKQREMTAKIVELSSSTGASAKLSDELRISEAGHMKALVDVELLKKDIVRAEEREEVRLGELRQAHQAIEALHAEKSAMAESRMLIQHDLDKVSREVETLKKQIAMERSEGERARQSVARLTLELAHWTGASPEAASISDEPNTEGELLASPEGLSDKEIEQGIPRDATGGRPSDSGAP
tara:strand:+ start:969 stop:2138 length:1170 start_codon:yes stop_codon:yes gene_type:complete